MSNLNNAVQAASERMIRLAGRLDQYASEYHAPSEVGGPTHMELERRYHEAVAEFERAVAEERNS